MAAVTEIMAETDMEIKIDPGYCYYAYFDGEGCEIYTYTEDRYVGYFAREEDRYVCRNSSGQVIIVLRDVWVWERIS